MKVYTLLSSSQSQPKLELRGMAAHESSPAPGVEDQVEIRRRTEMDYSLELERSKKVLSDPMMTLKLVARSSRLGRTAVTEPHGDSLLHLRFCFLLMNCRWFHPFLTRHAAECMLIDNAPEGTYLLRTSSSGSEYALSVK